jgi:hypothetical protein
LKILNENIPQWIKDGVLKTIVNPTAKGELRETKKN